jgi:alpha,alpha-trehalase
VDPKAPPPVDGRWPVYVSAREDASAIEQELRAEVSAADFARLSIRPLSTDPEAMPSFGILYLPKPYVVPGGRFNEMYGWDSYFIVLGLLDEGRPDLARDMVDDHLYEIEKYGTILNANRTYYLTRSQPPVFTRMVLAVYGATQDKEWLRGTLDAALAYYHYWTSPPHLTAETGLSRYFDRGRGPSPEVLSELDDRGHSHYERAREELANGRRDGFGYDPARFYDAKSGTLTPLFYVADRSMRESGFDPSDRFGRLGLGVIDYDPVCLNTLLWVMERDLATILTEIGRAGEADAWLQRAATRRLSIDRYLWDPVRGLYLDYDTTNGRRRDYPFATTFMPLWAGVASDEQARRVVANLSLFEAPGGIRTSTQRTGSQWDAPYVWAPLVLMAAQGLRRYGFRDEADRVSVNFLSMVLAEFIARGAIFEKYDGETRTHETSAGVHFGYTSNEVGFGWTNAAFLELWRGLTPARRNDVLHLDGVALPGHISSSTRPRVSRTRDSTNTNDRTANAKYAP